VIGLIVHGGAGHFVAERIEAARAGVHRACEAGVAWLRQGKSAIDVVERVVAQLEDDPTFDAGHGSYPNSAGQVEMDAILVDGATLRFGAVAAIRNTANPIHVARRVLDATPHCLLVGDGATRFAREQGFAFVPDAELAAVRSTPAGDTGTVGAVALDQAGHIAAATSTGGIKVKIPGRVGDSPLIGCGAIAEDRLGGVSATGEGEKLMQVMMSRTASEYLKAGLDAQAACEAAVRDLASRVNGRGGVICVDAAGRVGFAYNTTHLTSAYLNSDGGIVRTI
jgi:beta-aspartyl-peptidase (threonine type)